MKLLYGPVWTALGRGYEPFAPSCECLVPGKIGDWADVFDQAATKLS